MMNLRIPCFLICYKNLLSFVGTLHQFHPKSTLLQAPAVQRPQLATIWPRPWPRSFFHFLRGVSAIEVGSVTLVGQPGADSKEPTKRIKFNWVDHIFLKQTTIWLYMYQRNPVYQRDMAITSKLCCFEAAQQPSIALWSLQCERNEISCSSILIKLANGQPKKKCLLV